VDHHEVVALGIVLVHVHAGLEGGFKALVHLQVVDLEAEAADLLQVLFRPGEPHAVFPGLDIHRGDGTGGAGVVPDGQFGGEDRGGSECDFLHGFHQ
jgi:hypothetical protein